MSGENTIVGDAAFAANMAVTESLESHLGRKPKLGEAATALAIAYGDVCGLLAASGAKGEVIEKLNDLCTKSFRDTAKELIIADCAGAA